MLRELPARAEPDERHDDECADDGEPSEHRSVRDAIGLLGAGIDERRAGERPAGDERGGYARSRQQESTLHAFAREHEPEEHHSDCDDRAGA